MNIELMRLRAKLAEKKCLHKELDNKTSNLMISARNHLDPYEDDVTKLETELALQAVRELHETVQEMKKLKVCIEKLEKDLG